MEVVATSLQDFTTGQISEDNPSLMSRGTTVQSGQDEEAVVYTQSRMLQDPTGRLRRFPVLYIRSSLAMFVTSSSSNAAQYISCILK